MMPAGPNRKQRPRANKKRPFNAVVWVAQPPAGVVVGEEAHYLAFALASVHNLRREVGRRNQVPVEVVDLVAVPSAEFDLGV
jgi:hypothetical protein